MKNRSLKFECFFLWDFTRIIDNLFNLWNHFACYFTFRILSDEIHVFEGQISNNLIGCFLRSSDITLIKKFFDLPTNDESIGNISESKTIILTFLHQNYFFLRSEFNHQNMNFVPKKCIKLLIRRNIIVQNENNHLTEHIFHGTVSVYVVLLCTLCLVRCIMWCVVPFVLYGMCVVVRILWKLFNVC